MASDLISRDAVLKELEESLQAVKGGTKWMMGTQQGLENAVVMVKEAPAVDAVEVVRCKDCKHCAIDKYVKRPFCILNGEVKPDGHIWFGVGVSEEHYCSHGKRRTEDAVD